jgi:hypothetical protein
VHAVEAGRSFGFALAGARPLINVNAISGTTIKRAQDSPIWMARLARKKMRFLKSYERTHDVIENNGRRFWKATMSMKTGDLAVLSHDVIETKRFNMIFGNRNGLCQHSTRDLVH